MIYCKFKLLQANEDVRRERQREREWLVHLLQQDDCGCASGVRRHGRQLQQNKMKSVTTLQYEQPQIINQPLRNSVMHLVAHLHFVRLAQYLGGIGFEQRSAIRLS